MIQIVKYPSREEAIRLLARPSSGNVKISETVRGIISQVAVEGDAALAKFSLLYDSRTFETLEVSHKELTAAANETDPELKAAIALAAENIGRFHQAQYPSNFELETAPGIKCRLEYKPIERVGLYVPGGSAPLLSTVLMTVIPAEIAGCREIIVCTPPGVSPALLYTLSLFPVRVFRVGGAQAIAAMALGTESIPRVSKIFGPGNAYVTEAKMQLAASGMAIDMPAGPSEVLVIADHSARPEFVAADLLSQAEHGEDSQVVLVTTSEELALECLYKLRVQLSALPRRDIAEKSLQHSLIIITDSLEQAMAISNDYAPEHLILAVENPDSLSSWVSNAGSVFLGHHTPESAGDYASGTNHTLPTGGFARAWSGITTQSFMKSITFQEISPQGLTLLSKSVVPMARAESLEAHARAVLQRLPDNHYTQNQ